MQDTKVNVQLSSPPGISFRHDGPLAVIGAGLTGASWAALFASCGRKVRLFDNQAPALDDGLARARKHMHFLANHQLAEPEKVEVGLHELKACSEMAEAVEGVVFVQEAVYEDYAVKRTVFECIDKYAPRHALIATSSSGLSITRIQSTLRFADRCLAGHPYNPPHLIPLVEIAPGNKTSTAAIQTAQAFYKAVGKIPVVLKREVPGYLANRMSAALWREAINLVLDGVASVADVDRAIQFGPGLRWALMGPHRLYHLGGGEGGIQYHIEHLGAAKEEMWQNMNDWKTLPPETTDALKQGLPHRADISKLADERDVNLVKLIKALKIRKF
jgi:carnitine 3-dehydrogenase